ncbi:MAG TPA: peptidoglycan editing factor PgeF [Usitatibacter sp.]|nr:peptidoglycan editing factor PgeF [Usitatibacter sp.]
MSWQSSMRERLARHGAHWVVPEWPASPRVRAFVTTRSGGVSAGEYGSLNLGSRGGDAPGNVERNRLIVREMLPEAPRWLDQVHGSSVAVLDELDPREVPRADAAVARSAERVCAVLVADCMPVLLADEQGTRVAVAHAGWRGMSAGVIENAVLAMDADPATLLAWMGPAIGPEAFEVGPEVREAFVAGDPGAGVAFRPRGAGKYLADLYALARRRLARAGVARVHGGGFCTHRENQRFFSYRREKRSGRMGAFIWIEP